VLTILSAILIYLSEKYPTTDSVSIASLGLSLIGGGTLHSFRNESNIEVTNCELSLQFVLIVATMGGMFAHMWFTIVSQKWALRGGCLLSNNYS
jgi:hypothetical protein